MSHAELDDSDPQDLGPDHRHRDEVCRAIQGKGNRAQQTNRFVTDSGGILPHPVRGYYARLVIFFATHAGHRDTRNRITPVVDICGKIANSMNTTMNLHIAFRHRIIAW